MKKIICFVIGHKDGEKEISYIDEFGKHYKSTCKRCGNDIFYPTLEEELWELEEQLEVPYKNRFYRKHII